jgi:metal-sulfur cluster biosynthetic enzyme
MAVTKRRIMGKLSGVVDPELGVNIVDLGLIYEVRVKKAGSGGKQKAEVVMTFTTPACPLANYLLGQVESRLNELPDIDISVRVVFEPAWSQDRMSEKAKIKLGMK